MKRKEFRFLTCDVFTGQPFAGNPLAVFPDADGLDGGSMQRIAREFNLSETTFVFPPTTPDADFRVSIFTPTRELPFAGHPTIGTALVMSWIGAVEMTGPETLVKLEEDEGIVRVSVHLVDAEPAYADLTVPSLPEKEPRTPELEDIALALSLDPEEILANRDRAEVWTCGTSCLLVPLRSAESVKRAHPRLGDWPRAFADSSLAGAYVFSYASETDDADIHARFFAPELGISEDPATGAAAAAIGGYLGTRDPSREGILRWTIQQGREMGRPSEILLTVEKKEGNVTAVRVGGRAVAVTEGFLEVEVERIQVPPP